MTRKETKQCKEYIKQLTLEEKEKLLNDLYLDPKWDIRSIVAIFEYQMSDVVQYFKDLDIRVCSKCGKVKSFEDFYKKYNSPFGVEPICKSCKNDGGKKRYKENPDKHKIVCKSYYEKHKEEHIQRMTAYINDPEYPERKEKHRAGTKRYMHENRDKFRDRETKYKQDRLKNNPKLRVSHNISTYIRTSLNGQKHGRHWEDLLGYTLQDLIIHLESKFDDKMNWENYGSYWHIDHVVGIANFNYTSYEDEAFKKCWSLQNLQPLYGPDNSIKGDTISEKWNNVELAAQLL
jgi:hypothetical protein